MNPVPISSAADPLWGFLLRLAVEITVLLVIIPLIYKRYSDNKEHMFSFFLMGIMIFTLCVLLKKVEIQMGIALGLFAIFSIIRFRTVNFSVKDMSYLFSIIGLSAINAMFDFPHPIRGTIIINLLVIFTILVLEVSFKSSGDTVGGKVDKKKKKKKEKTEQPQNCLQLLYDKTDLLIAGMSDELFEDISKRTGKTIEEVRIRRIDLINGNAELDVFYKISPDNTDK
jgi:hypothetical protein